MNIFRRDNQIVLKMFDTYNGTIDFEISDSEGRLITHTLTGGFFEPNEEIVFDLPDRDEIFLIVRGLREDGHSATMKIFN